MGPAADCLWCVCLNCCPSPYLRVGPLADPRPAAAVPAGAEEGATQHAQQARRRCAATPATAAAAAQLRVQQRQKPGQQRPGLCVVEVVVQDVGDVQHPTLPGQLVCVGGVQRAVGGKQQAEDELQRLHGGEGSSRGAGQQQ